MAEAVTLLAVGDVLIDREQPESIFAHTAGRLRSADIVFAQLEQMYSDKGFISPFVRHVTHSPPSNIPALTSAGFHVVSLAGNHTLDWGPEALLDSIERLRAAGLAVIGVGRNLAEARQPAIIDRKGVRVAFLAYGCIGPEGYEAQADKPGYAPMRAWTHYQQVDYQPGTPPRILTFPYPEDMRAMREDIRQARSQAEIVVVSFHWGIHFTPAVIPMYAFEVGHAAIDAGADLILGHHAHILKGIEVYRGKVIFHSLANFALEIRRHPEWNPYLRTSTFRHLRELYNIRPDPEYPTYPMHPEAKRTIVAKAIIRDKKIERVSYLPAYINKRAEPELLPRHDPRSQEVYDYMQQISESQHLNVSYAWDGEEVVVSE